MTAVFAVRLEDAHDVCMNQSLHGPGSAAKAVASFHAIGELPVQHLDRHQAGVLLVERFPDGGKASTAQLFDQEISLGQAVTGSQPWPLAQAALQVKPLRFNGRDLGWCRPAQEQLTPSLA